MKTKINQDAFGFIFSQLSFDEKTSKKIQFFKSIRNVFIVMFICSIMINITSLSVYSVILPLIGIAILATISLLIRKEETEYEKYCLEFIDDLKKNQQYFLSELERYRLYRNLSDEKKNQVNEKIQTLLSVDYDTKNYKEIIDSRYENFLDFEYTEDAEDLAKLFIYKFEFR